MVHQEAYVTPTGTRIRLKTSLYNTAAVVNTKDSLRRTAVQIKEVINRKLFRNLITQ